MKRILCPVDFSQAAENGVEYAVRLAKKINAGITLINVQVLAELSVQEAVFKSDLNLQSSWAQLEEMSEGITKAFHVPCGFVVEKTAGSLSKMIGSKARDYDLIVMGTQGTDSIHQLLFGTHTYKVMQETKVPVLLVPEDCVYKDLKSIVFAFDYWRTHQLPISTLLAFARVLESRILILEVLEESVSQKVEKELKEDQEQIKQLYADEGVALQFDTIHTDDLPTSIHSYMIRSQADVLALCSVRHSLIEKMFHKSVIKNISGTASYPVFVFQ